MVVDSVFGCRKKVAKDGRVCEAHGSVALVEISKPKKLILLIIFLH